jgi:hypothetical protein
MNLPLTTFDLGPDIFSDQRMLVLAREIAMNIHPVEDIIERHGIKREDFETILRNERFARLLEDAATSWEGALNTGERIKVKSLSMLEDWLASAYAMLHEPKHPLRDKVELAKLVGRFAGMGEKSTLDTNTADRVNITINLGAEKHVAAEFTIEHEGPTNVDSTPLERVA